MLRKSDALPMFLSRRCENMVSGTPVNVPMPKDTPRSNLLAPISSIYQNKKLSRKPQITPATRNTTRYEITSTLHNTFCRFLKIFFAGGLKPKFSLNIHKDATRRNKKYK